MIHNEHPFLSRRSADNERTEVAARIADALKVHEQSLESTALKTSMDNLARQQMVRAIQALLLDFEKSFGRKLFVRLRMAGNGRSVSVRLKPSLFYFHRKPDHFRISADVDTFIQSAWGYKVVKCNRLWYGGVQYSHELVGSVPANQVIDFLIGKAIACMPARS